MNNFKFQYWVITIFMFNFQITYSQTGIESNEYDKILTITKKCSYFDDSKSVFIEARFTGEVNNEGYANGKGIIYRKFNNGNKPFIEQISGTLINGKFEGFAEITTCITNTTEIVIFNVKFKNGYKEGEGVLNFEKDKTLNNTVLRYMICNFKNGKMNGPAVAYNSSGNFVASGNCNGGNCILEKPYSINLEKILIGAGLIIAADYLINNGGNIFNLGKFYNDYSENSNSPSERESVSKSNCNCKVSFNSITTENNSQKIKYNLNGCGYSDNIGYIIKENYQYKVFNSYHDNQDDAITALTKGKGCTDWEWK